MLKAAFRFIVNTCFAVVRRVLLIAAGGAAVNWLFAVVLFFALSGWTFAKVALVVIVFLLGFPVAWLLLGKTYGLRQGIYELVTTHKIALFEYLIYQLTATAQAKTLDNPKIQQSLLQSRQWLAQMPAPVRWVMSGLIRYLPLNEVLWEAIQNQRLTEENLTTLSRLAAQKLDAYTNISLLQPSPRPLQLLAAVNLAAMVLAGVVA
jgi:D-alanyl-lipoteichoic acid acyltransferase DltB (MBOAT superfamily)